MPAVRNRDQYFRNCTSQNQGLWIDIHLPHDQQNYPAGIYYGKVQVWEKGKIVKEFPLEITLLPYYLPDENRTDVWMYSGDVKSYFPDLSQDNLDRMIKFEAHRHRINMEGGFEVNRSPFNREKMEKYKSYLDDSAFTPANGYHGPGEGKGEKIFPIGMYGTEVMGNTKIDIQKQADLWVDWFLTNAPGIIYFWYIIDEPGKDLYPWIKERAEWVKSNPGSGKSLPIFTTTHYQEELSGAIDIFAAYDGVDLDKLADARQNGRDYWFYNGNRPRTGSTILEGTAVDCRVNS